MVNSNTLSAAALDWSLAHHQKHGDTDLFPVPFELGVLAQHWASARSRLVNVDIATHTWAQPRRLLVPKDHLVFRRGTQLDPVDSLLYAAIINEIGAQIETRRIPVAQQLVFSSRFAPTVAGQLYSQADFWGHFWKKSAEAARKASWVVVCDISDFYQQVDHSVIRSQLELANVAQFHRLALLECLRNASGDAGRGLPVGPHASHLIAEMSLIPLDNMLLSFYPTFCRFIDDIHIFCGSEAEGERALYDLANILDSTLHLSTSGRKTKLVPAATFLAQAESMVVRGDLDEEETRILEVVQEMTDSPYTFASFDDIPTEKRDLLSQEAIEEVLDGYLDDPNGPDFPKLRWFLRRLSQVGAPGAIEFVIENLHRLTPAMPDAATYLRTAGPEFDGDWKALGAKLVDALNYPIVERSEYLQFVICSLFTRISDLNHFDRLASYFLNAHSIARREIILAARHSKVAGWLESNATTVEGLDSWEARAVIFAADALPKVQRQKLAKEIAPGDPSIVKSLLVSRLLAGDGDDGQETTERAHDHEIGSLPALDSKNRTRLAWAGSVAGLLIILAIVRVVYSVFFCSTCPFRSLTELPQELLDARKPNLTHSRFVHPADEAGVPSTRDGTLLLFVHGIFGDTLDTWKGKNGRHLWDYLLARPEFSRGFDAFAFGFVSEEIKQGSYKIKEAAQTLHTAIVTHQMLSRYKRIVIVAHSMGGLVAMQALVDFPDLRDRIPVVVTYGTPYDGSQITTLGARVLNNPALVEMFPSSDYVTQLGKDWAGLRESAAPVPRVLCAYEKLGLPGIGIVVEQKSAVSLCDKIAEPIPEDHIGIVKPDSDSHGSVDWLSYALQPLRPNLPSGYQDVLFDVDLIRAGVTIPAAEKFAILSPSIVPTNVDSDRLGTLVLRATAHVDPVTTGQPPIFEEARLVFYAESLKAAQRVTRSAIQLDLDAADNSRIWKRAMDLVQAGITAGHVSGGKNILLCIKGQSGPSGTPFWGVDLGGIGWAAGAPTRVGHYRMEHVSASFGGADVRSVCEGYGWQ